MSYRTTEPAVGKAFQQYTLYRISAESKALEAFLLCQQVAVVYIFCAMLCTGFVIDMLRRNTQRLGIPAHHLCFYIWCMHRTAGKDDVPYNSFMVEVYRPEYPRLYQGIPCLPVEGVTGHDGGIITQAFIYGLVIEL
ncbi:hypothetical protein D3C72_444820 [compost metagenome]